MECSAGGMWRASNIGRCARGTRAPCKHSRSALMEVRLPVAVVTEPSYNGICTAANISRLCVVTDPMSGSRSLGSGDFPQPRRRRCVHWERLIRPSENGTGDEECLERRRPHLREESPEYVQNKRGNGK